MGMGQSKSIQSKSSGFETEEEQTTQTQSVCNQNATSEHCKIKMNSRGSIKQNSTYTSSESRTAQQIHGASHTDIVNNVKAHNANNRAISLASCDNYKVKSTE